jgi:hypothetical protein
MCWSLGYLITVQWHRSVVSSGPPYALLLLPPPPSSCSLPLLLALSPVLTDVWVRVRGCTVCPVTCASSAAQGAEYTVPLSDTSATVSRNASLGAKTTLSRHM